MRAALRKPWWKRHSAGAVCGQELQPGSRAGVLSGAAVSEVVLVLESQEKTQGGKRAVTVSATHKEHKDGRWEPA